MSPPPVPRLRKDMKVRFKAFDMEGIVTLVSIHTAQVRITNCPGDRRLEGSLVSEDLSLLTPIPENAT